jgi:hypothetical protein
MRPTEWSSIQEVSEVAGRSWVMTERSSIQPSSSPPGVLDQSSMRPTEWSSIQEAPEVAEQSWAMMGWSMIQPALERSSNQLAMMRHETWNNPRRGRWQPAG